MKIKLKYINIFLLVTLFVKLISMQRESEEFQTRLPAEVNVKILEHAIESIINNNDILNPLAHVQEFINNIALVSHEFYSYKTQGGYLSKFAKKYAQAHFANEERQLTQNEKDAQLKRILEVRYSREVEEKAAKLIIAGAFDPEILFKIELDMQFEALINLFEYKFNDENKMVDVNKQDNLGNTVLVYAALNGNYAMARVLIGAGADINMANNSGSTALMYAAINNQIDIIDLLLDNNADMNIQNGSGNTALMLAIKNNNEEIAELLINEKPYLDFKNRRGYTALTLAIRNGNDYIATLLINNGADINIPTKCQDTSLIIAVQRKNSYIAELLIKNRVDVNMQNRYCNNALILACKLGQHEIVGLLIEAKAKLDVRDYDGYTALMNAIRYGYESIAKALIEAGAKLDVKDRFGNTALEIAQMNKRENIKILLEKKLYSNKH